MRIIVTGANGFAGREVVIAALRRGHEVLAVGGSKAVVVPDLLRSITMDLRDIAAVQTLMLEEFPQAVINCAALATIDGCDREPAKAEALNVDLPRRLAQLSFHVGA